VKDKLKRFELFNRFGAELFFPTVGEAVKTYRRTYPVDWPIGRRAITNRQAPPRLNETKVLVLKMVAVITLSRIAGEGGERKRAG